MARDITETLTLEEIDTIAKEVYGNDYEAIGSHIVKPTLQAFFDIPGRKGVRAHLKSLAHESLRGKPVYKKFISRILKEYDFRIPRRFDGNQIAARLLFTDEMYKRCFDEKGLARHSS